MSRTVLITGGSSGIGIPLVQQFAAQGDRVWFTYRSGQERADAIIADLPGRDVQAFYLDQGDWDSQAAFIAGLPGDVDVLINNAALGSATVKDYADGGHIQDQAMMQVNAVGPLWLVKALLPGMIARGYGKIVNIGSVNGGVAQFPGFSLADGMSKAAIAFMTKQLAAEMVHTPVDVFAVCPGATRTAMFEASTLAKLSDEQRRGFIESLPKKRLIEPEEIAAIVLFLCSDAARCLHGAVIDASLGLGVHPGAFTASNQYL